MSLSLAELTSEELVRMHRSINKKSGAKGHVATPAEKQEKLLLKDEIARRSRAENCQHCQAYLAEREGNQDAVPIEATAPAEKSTPQSAEVYAFRPGTVPVQEQVQHHADIGGFEPVAASAARLVAKVAAARE